MPWYSIRSVYHFGTKADGVNMFEERIVAFEADTEEAAHAKGESESFQYAAELNIEVHEIQDGYRLDDSPLIDGYEIWSQLLESRLPLAEFFAERYLRYDYTPELE